MLTDFLRDTFAFNPNSPLLFTQSYFWVFLLFVFAVFSLMHNKILLRNAFLFFVSVFFYYKTSGLFLLILAFITISDWLIARRIQNSDVSIRKKLWLTLSVVIDLSLLFYRRRR